MIKSARYKIAICGRKDKSIPNPEKSAAINPTAAGAAPSLCAHDEKVPPISSVTHPSNKFLRSTPGILSANARKNTASSVIKNSGTATNGLYRSFSARLSRNAPPDHTPASASGEQRALSGAPE